LSSKKEKIYRIAITGPESTGKSTLAKGLADHYNTIWVPEYAREYLGNLDRPYSEMDLLKIAQGQLALENSLQKEAHEFTFCDTELLVIKIWSEYKYGKAHPFIHENLSKNPYDLYLLMDIDLPWEYDPQREHPDKRRFFFDWYEKELKRLNANYYVVRGSSQKRMENAVKIVDAFFRSAN